MSNKRNKNSRKKSNKAKNVSQLRSATLQSGLLSAYYGYQNDKGEGVEARFTSDNKLANAATMYEVTDTKEYADSVIKQSQKMLNLEKASGESLDVLCKALLEQLDIMAGNLAVMADDSEAFTDAELKQINEFVFALAPMNIIILETFGYIKADNFNGASYMAINAPYRATALTW